MNENKNKNRFNDMDSEDYRDKKYYLNQRNEIKKEKNLAKKKRKLEREKRRYEKIQAFKNSISKFRLGTKSYMGELFHPNTLVGIILAIILILDSRKIQQEVKNQAEKIDQIERVLESQTDKVSSTKQFINENWQKIVFIVGPILTRIVIDYINHSRTVAEQKIELSTTKQQVIETEQQVVEAEQKLETSKVELKNEKIRGEQALEQEKIQSARKVEQAEKAALVKINKLHVTLRRFNDQALEYAQKEMEMRQQIVESKNELAEAITQRDFFSRQLEESTQMIQTKTHELSKSSIELKSLRQNLDEVEESQSKLLTQLQNADQEKMSLKKLVSRKESKLQKSINEKNKERLELLSQIGNQEKDIGTLRVEKEQLSKTLESTIKDQKLLEEETEKLKAKSSQNEIDLQSSIDKTNRVVLKMDGMSKQLQTLRLRNQKTSGENIHLRQKVEAERQVAEQQEKQLFENDQKNQELENECQKLKTEKAEAIIREDELKKELELDRLKLQHASDEQKSQLEKVIQKTEKQLKTVEREKQNLEKISAKQEKKLAKQYIEQDELINKNRKQLATIYEFGTNYFSQLQRERLYQEQQFKTTIQQNSELANQLIDQQEKDQSIPWYRKMIFQITPEISLNKNPKEEKIIERESYFFGGWSPEIPHGTIKVKEKINPKTKQYEIVEPKRSNAIKIK